MLTLFGSSEAVLDGTHWFTSYGADVPSQATVWESVRPCLENNGLNFTTVATIVVATRDSQGSTRSHFRMGKKTANMHNHLC